MSGRGETQFARCPHCWTTDGLILMEVHEEFGETDPGRHEVHNGQIVPCSAFHFTAGDPVRIIMACTSCGHEWRSRRTVAA